MDEIQKTTQRNVEKAKILLKTNSKAFITDYNGTYFFCTIMKIGSHSISFKPFKGNHAGIIIEKFWCDIKFIDKYREKDDVPPDDG